MVFVCVVGGGRSPHPSYLLSCREWREVAIDHGLPVVVLSDPVVPVEPDIRADFQLLQEGAGLCIVRPETDEAFSPNSLEKTGWAVLGSESRRNLDDDSRRDALFGLVRVHVVVAHDVE